MLGCEPSREETTWGELGVDVSLLLKRS